MGRNLRKLELRFCLNRSPFVPFFQLIIIFNPRKNLWGAEMREWKKSEKRKSFKIISPWCLKEKPMMAIAFFGGGDVIPTLLKRKTLMWKWWKNLFSFFFVWKFTFHFFISPFFERKTDWKTRLFWNSWSVASANSSIWLPIHSLLTLSTSTPQR